MVKKEFLACSSSSSIKQVCLPVAEAAFFTFESSGFVPSIARNLSRGQFSTIVARRFFAENPWRDRSPILCGLMKYSFISLCNSTTQIQLAETKFVLAPGACCCFSSYMQSIMFKKGTRTVLEACVYQLNSNDEFKVNQWSVPTREIGTRVSCSFFAEHRQQKVSQVRKMAWIIACTNFTFS